MSKLSGRDDLSVRSQNLLERPPNFLDSGPANAACHRIVLDIGVSAVEFMSAEKLLPKIK